MSQNQHRPQKRGPKEDRLIIDGDPENALERLLAAEMNPETARSEFWREGDTPVGVLMSRIHGPAEELVVGGKKGWYIIDGVTEPSQGHPARVSYWLAPKPSE